MIHFKKIVSLIATVSILMASAVIPVTIHAEDDTPNTPLYLFRDTIENHTAGISISGTAYGVSNTLIDGIWETSESFGGAWNHNTYGIFAESYTQYNKILGLAPSIRSGGELCVLNLVKDLGDAKDYVYSVDMKLSKNLAGIRLADSSDDTSYYELAIISDENGSKARFSKVADAVYDTPVIPEEWLYADFSSAETISDDTWLTLSLARKDNVFYWSVYNKTANCALFNGSFPDTSPLFAEIGRLQLFAYGEGKTDALTLFDNIDAKRLGADFYKDEDGLKFEVSWINNSENQPLIAVADYDDQGRVSNVQIFNDAVMDSQISKGYPGYFICYAPLNNSETEKKLFVWDSKTTQPVYSSTTYEYDTTNKFAILEMYSNDRVTLVLADGSRAVYDLCPGTQNTYLIGNTVALSSVALTSLLATNIPAKANIQNRVVMYRISGDEVNLYAPSVVPLKLTATKYNPILGKVGAVTVEEGVEFIDASKYAGNVSDYAKFDTSRFSAQADYTGYAFKASATDNFYSFVTFTSIGYTFTEKSRFAVLLENVTSKMTPDSGPIYGAKALYNGEETVLYWENMVSLAQGDAIFFTTDADGLVNRQYKIYDKIGNNSIIAFRDALIADADYDSSDWAWDTFNTSAADIRLVAGYVTDVASNAITFGVADSNGDINFANVEVDITGNMSGLFTYGIADECQAYEYNSGASGRESTKYALTDAAAIIESNLVEVGTDIYSVADANSLVTSAIALVVNGDVVCIYANY